jgi:hypothetical protein
MGNELIQIGTHGLAKVLETHDIKNDWQVMIFMHTRGSTNERKLEELHNNDKRPADATHFQRGPSVNNVIGQAHFGVHYYQMAEKGAPVVELGQVRAYREIQLPGSDDPSDES